MPQIKPAKISSKLDWITSKSDYNGRKNVATSTENSRLTKTVTKRFEEWSAVFSSLRLLRSLLEININNTDNTSQIRIGKISFIPAFSNPTFPLALS